MSQLELEHLGSAGIEEGETLGSKLTSLDVEMLLSIEL